MNGSVAKGCDATTVAYPSTATQSVSSTDILTFYQWQKGIFFAVVSLHGSEVVGRITAVDSLSKDLPLHFSVKKKANDQAEQKNKNKNR